MFPVLTPENMDFRIIFGEFLNFWKAELNCMFLAIKLDLKLTFRALTKKYGFWNIFWRISKINYMFFQWRHQSWRHLVSLKILATVATKILTIGWRYSLKGYHKKPNHLKRKFQKGHKKALYPHPSPCMKAYGSLIRQCNGMHLWSRTSTLLSPLF